MLIESALGIVALIAVGMVFDKYTGGAFGGPPAAFAAGIALMAVCAWLGQAVKNKIVMIGAGQALWGDWFQLIFAAAMAILALFLVAEGIQTFKKQKLSKASA